MMMKRQATPAEPMEMPQDKINVPANTEAHIQCETVGAFTSARRVSTHRSGLKVGWVINEMSRLSFGRKGAGECV